jgi:polyisoprenoid-binding protein YceI
MKKISFIISLFLLSINLTNAQTLNGEESIVNFNITKMGGKTIEGTFGGMKGEIRFEKTDLDNSSFKVSIDVATVNTESKKRDKDLRNEKYFFVEEYPVILFESGSIKKTDEGFLTVGKLTMRGISKEVEIPFTYKDGKFTGKLEVNRFDYKIAEEVKTKTVGEIASMEIIAVVN